ncbi:MAG: ATP-binding protein [Oscillatoriaceae cyanobacterium]
MLKKLRLERFKNFESSELTLGSFNVLVGTNAAGKSNLREAFRFLHGIARGYNLAEIIGEKWIEGGVIQWRGIRGGTREIAFHGASTFRLEVDFLTSKGEDATYKIEVNPGSNGEAPRVMAESLYVAETSVFDESLSQLSHEERLNMILNNPNIISIKYNNDNDIYTDAPIFSQTIRGNFKPSYQEKAQEAIAAFRSMRFLDLSPEAMRLPSLPGQTTLGDRGENLSSVLQAICQNPQRRETLRQWLAELTPMDAVDFEFPADFTGKILLTLVEKNGQKTSAYSASDGTLRFLAIIAALLGPEPAKFYFFEELENGIHPTRLHLLLQLIETQVNRQNIQIVATTHSSQLLGLLSDQSLESASLIYRLEHHHDAKIIRILDIPEAKNIIKEQHLSRLHASAWLEDVMEFTADDEVAE